MIFIPYGIERKLTWAFITRHTQLSGAAQCSDNAKFTAGKSRCYSLRYSACHGGGRGSIVGQPMLDLLRTKLHVSVLL